MKKNIMKFIRGLYIVTIWILGLPFLIMFVFSMFVWACVVAMHDKYNMDEFKDLIVGGLFEGLKIGHASNMRFIKYGRDYGLSEMEAE